VDRYIDTNGVCLHVIDHEGDGPVLVLAPGLTANSHSFDGLVAHGLAPSMRVLALDLRGRGESDKPDGGYDLEDHAADIIGVLDALDIDRVFMGGHSYGGMLSFWTAANHPERVIGCVTLDPPVEVDEQVRAQIQPSLDRLDKTLPSFEAYVDAMKAMPFFEGWWDPMIENYFRADVEKVAGGVRPRSSVEHIDAVLDGCVKIDWESTVRSVSQPSLLIRATEPYGPPGYPPILTEELASRTMSRLQHGTMVEVHANHMTMLFGEAAGQTVAAILAFVEGV
jgi:pimeloyl-ACP methyl ester carboxylesterase